MILSLLLNTERDPFPMPKLKRLMELIHQGEYRKIINYAVAFLPKQIYSLSASLRDKRFGGKSVTICTQKVSEEGQ